MVSIKTIAEECGVSIATVSKALNNHSDVGVATKQLVCETAKRLGYLPNAQARALKTNKTYNIGVLLNDKAKSGLTHCYFSAVLDGFRVEAEKKGYDITFICGQIGGSSMSYYEHCVYRCVDGILAACVDFYSNEVRELMDGDIPMVSIDFRNENGEQIHDGRNNLGVISLNLPRIALEAKGDEATFWKLLDERLDLCYEALMVRHNALKGIRSDVSPIHWQNGAIARLKKGETIDKLLESGYSTLSLGYIGLYECTKAMKGVSHTTPEGEEFAMRVMKRLRKACDDWKAKTGLGFALYGTPAESLCYRFARIDKERFGTIKDITDKGYYTNSYHVDVREPIDAFSKFKFESQFQPISSGGCISYVEIPNMKKNPTAIEDVVRFIYDNIQYAEFNTKSDYCQVCGFDGEIQINDNLEWECPQCHNKDQSKMNVTRRTCGYLGENFWNVGKTKEIKSRVLHL